MNLLSRNEREAIKNFTLLWTFYEGMIGGKRKCHHRYGRGGKEKGRIKSSREDMRMGVRIDEFLSRPETERQYLEVVPARGWEEATLETLGWAVVPVVQAGRVIYDLIRKAGLPTVAGVKPEVASELKFPLGPGRSGVLYKRHPYDAIRYVPAAEYNPYIFKDKIAELARVMISAGATSFHITTNAANASDIALDAAALVVSGSFKAVRRGATKVVWSYTGSGQNTGVLPDRLFWFDHEKDWQTIWESAVHHGAKSHEILISHGVNVEFNGNLAERFTRAGFNLGGSFRDTHSFRLKVEVSFAKGSTRPKPMIAKRKSKAGSTDIG